MIRVLLALLALTLCSPALATNGSSMAYRSSGSNPSGSDWLLNENGYVGTYVTLPTAGNVTLSVNASGVVDGGSSPRMNMVVDDFAAGFDVQPGFSTYQHTFSLSAGTHFVRTEFANDVPTANRQLTVRSFTATGATISNTASDTNALAAADTYIANYRQGQVKIALGGVAPGTTVNVKMARNAFNFGTMVQGFDANTFLGTVAPGDTTSTAARYQNFVSSHFNTLVPSNMGKWDSNEATANQPTMGQVDTILNYADAHHMSVRMHNLIWGNQQPSWVNTLISGAKSSDPAVSGPAKTSLMNAIANRISYYVGDGDADTADGDRSRKYIELDVLNEALREGTYHSIFSDHDIAQIYQKVQTAVTAAGAQARLYTNEYNVLQYSTDPVSGASDLYANWYRHEVEAYNNAGLGQVVTGIGVQYSVDARTSNAQVHSASRIESVLQNLSVTGLPITLTEFSVQPTTGGVTASLQRSSDIYSESLRMVYGTPQATSFLIWEAWPPSTTDNTTIVDSNWKPTQSGQTLIDLLNSWTTPTQNLVVGPDGTIDLHGFWGDYDLTINGHSLPLTLSKGTTLYSVAVAPGDYNADGHVDAADYIVWRRALASTADLRADGNANGVVDVGDFDVWRSHFGYVYGSGTSLSTAVPEPSTVAMIVIGMLASLTARRRSFSR
jgi:GH35 family endo-1,4-beta-xylanase